MQKIYKYLLTIPVLLLLYNCNNVLEQDVYSSIEMNALYDSQISAEIGLTGCYNRFFNENAYPLLMCYYNVSTDDIKQPSGWGHQLKDRTLLNSTYDTGTAWSRLYSAIANANLLLEMVEDMPDELFSINRKKEILAEGHFLRGISLYYLTMMWGDIPMPLELKIGGPEENPLAKSPQSNVLAQIKADLTIAANDLPNILSNYKNDPVTNEQKGRASKWAAKAYLARIALYENNLDVALSLSNEIIESGVYPLASKWRNIFQEPMNSSESIFEMQNDYSPGFFGSGQFGWFMGFAFQISEDAFKVFGETDTSKTTQGKDIRWEYTRGKHPWNANLAIRKHVPPRGYDLGGIEQMNLVLIRATEIYFNKYEVLIEQNFEANKQDAIDFLNFIRSRAEDLEWENPFWPEKPKGAAGIPSLTLADVDTKEKMIAALRNEKRREMMYEDGIRWLDLLRWDKEYAKSITNSASDDKLYLPYPPEEMLRNTALVQNPAYQ